MKELEGTRFDGLLRDEPARKYLFEHHITPENYQAHKDELRRFFQDDADWTSFEAQYLTHTPLLSYRKFWREGQHMDAFPHPRYIQQDFHIHDFFEMKYQLSGSGTIFLDSEMLFLKESDVCLISPYVPHRNEVYTDDASMLNIVLPPEYLPVLLPRVLSFPNRFGDYLSQRHMGVSAPGGDRWLHCQTHRHPAIRRVFEDLLACFADEKNRSPLRALQAEADFERAFLWMLEQQPVQSSRSPANTDSGVMTRWVDYMRAHLADASLGAMAARFHFSPSYMSRTIKRQTGFSFQMLMLILRMDAAAKLLRESALSVDQIAASVGLTGKTYFYEKFRAFYGVNPGAYRSHYGRASELD